MAVPSSFNVRNGMNTRHIIPIALIVLPTLSLAQGGGGGADIHVSGQFISDEPTGNPPLKVNSSTNVPNLNADKLDGFDAGDFAVEGSGVGVHYKNLVGVPGREIDQDCAAGGGCFSGDFGGFPVTITEPGSYRLASNLDIRSELNAENLNVIEVSADDVTLDLAGFAILGPTECSGSPVTSCSPTGSGVGVDFNDSGSRFLGTVENGVIRGMGQFGIDSDRSISVENMRISESGASGVTVSNGIGRVKGSVIFRNGGDGLFGSLLVVDTSTQENGGRGIFLNPGGTAQDNQVLENAGDGIRCGACLLLDNVVNNNVGFGLDLDGGASYGRNLIFNNDAGHINDTGINHEIQTNTCGTGAAGAFAC